MEKIEIDFVPEVGESATETLEEMVLESGALVTPQLISENGPGGGNPNAFIMGDRLEVTKFLRHHQYDLETYGL